MTIFMVSMLLNMVFFIYFLICEKKYKIIQKIINKLKGVKIDYDKYQLNNKIKGNMFLYNYLKKNNVKNDIVFLGDSILEMTHFHELITKEIVFSNRAVGGEISRYIRKYR